MNNFILHITTAKANLFKSLFDALKDILSDFHLIIYGKTILISQPNTSEPSLANLYVRVEIDGTKLEKFYCDPKFTEHNPLKLGLNTSSINNFTKTIKSRDSLSFIVDESFPDKLILRKDNGDEKTVSKYIIQLKEFESDGCNVSGLKLEYSQPFKMKSTKFYKIIKEYSTISNIDKRKDEIEIRSVGNKLIFKGYIVQDVYECVVEGLMDDELQQQKYNINQSFYNVRHLLTITKATTLSPELTLCLQNDMPLTIRYAISDIGEVLFLLMSN